MGVCGANIVLGHKIQMREDFLHPVGAGNNNFLAVFQQQMGMPIVDRARHLHGDSLLLVLAGVDNLKAMFLWQMMSGTLLRAGWARYLHGDCFLLVHSWIQPCFCLHMFANIVLGHKIHMGEDCLHLVGTGDYNSLAVFQQTDGEVHYWSCKTSAWRLSAASPLI
jgi:hypothetical protein